MTWEDNLALLEEYKVWVAQRKAGASDTSPETFMVHKAEAEAMRRNIKVAEHVAYIIDEPETFTVPEVDMANKIMSILSDDDV